MGQDVRVVVGVPTVANFALGGGTTPNAPLILNISTGAVYYLAAGDVVTPITPIGAGTVTTVSVATANGFSGTVANATTTPAITIIAGAITPTSVAASGTVSGSNLSGTNTGDQTNITGNAATVTTNANLTGPITSAGNATSIASQTGTGSKFVMDTSPTLVTPKATTTIGVGNATPSASGSGISFPATQSASTDANTLDDYEEGTWTPTDASGAGLSLTINDATYTKVGREVMARAQIHYPVTASGAGATIGGFPFTINNFGASVAQIGGAANPLTNGQLNGTTMALLIAGNAALTNAQMSSNFLLFNAVFDI